MGQSIGRVEKSELGEDGLDYGEVLVIECIYDELSELLEEELVIVI